MYRNSGGGTVYLYTWMTVINSLNDSCFSGSLWVHLKGLLCVEGNYFHVSARWKHQGYFSVKWTTKAKGFKLHVLDVHYFSNPVRFPSWLIQSTILPTESTIHWEILHRYTECYINSAYPVPTPGISRPEWTPPIILPLKTFKLSLLQTCRRHRLAEEANESRSVVYTSSHYFKVRFVSVQYPTRMVSVNFVAFPSEIPVISLIWHVT